MGAILREPLQIDAAPALRNNGLIQALFLLPYRKYA
jgi:hypothetical protein